MALPHRNSRASIEVMLVLRSAPPRRLPGLNALVQRFHADLQPLHPGIGDPRLARFYRLSLPVDEFAPERLEELRHVDGVEAAYIKPPDVAPARP